MPNYPGVGPITPLYNMVLHSLNLKWEERYNEPGVFPNQSHFLLLSRFILHLVWILYYTQRKIKTLQISTSLEWFQNPALIISDPEQEYTKDHLTKSGRVHKTQAWTFLSNHSSFKLGLKIKQKQEKYPTSTRCHFIICGKLKIGKMKVLSFHQIYITWNLFRKGIVYLRISLSSKVS